MSDYRQSGLEPAVRPGEIWLIEQPAAAALCPSDRDALRSANVVIYDPALASLVAEALPLGSYAERSAALAAMTAPTISPRALHFAEQGWSVVQFVKAGPEERARTARIFGPVALCYPMQGHAFTANGLAG